MTALEQFGLILWNTGRLFPNLVLNLDELVVLSANGVNELCHRRFDILHVGGQGLLFCYQTGLSVRQALDTIEEFFALGSRRRDLVARRLKLVFERRNVRALL